MTERVASTTRGDTPTAAIIRVRPEEIANRSFMGNLLDAIELTDLVEGVNAGGQTTVEAENLVLDNGSKREVIEKFGEYFPYVGVSVFTEALIVKTVPKIIVRCYTSGVHATYT